MPTIESDCMNECTIYLCKVTISFIQLVPIWVLLQRTDHNTGNFMPYCNNLTKQTSSAGVAVCRPWRILRPIPEFCLQCSVAGG